VEFLNRGEIDAARWDEVISRSQAETLYPYSWYLDAVAENWSALVADGYRFVMPLVWKRRAGIRYLYQPYYTQQLGVFSWEPVDPSIITSMLAMLPGKYRFGTIHLNAGNRIGAHPPFSLAERTNFVLRMGPGYETLRAGYSENTRRNLLRAGAANNEVARDVTCRELVDFKRENDVIRRSDKQARWLVSLLQTIQAKGSGEIYAVRDKGVLSAATFFGFSLTRAIYLVSASSGAGKENRSMFKLVDAFIRDHAGSDLLLDFEGSNIPGVARFFEGFGAGKETYQSVSFSRMPRLAQRFISYV
jgi:hypothetical protein